MNRACIAAFEQRSIDGSRIAIEFHADVQAIVKYRRHDRALRGNAGLSLDQRSKSHCLMYIAGGA